MSSAEIPKTQTSAHPWLDKMKSELSHFSDPDILVDMLDRRMEDRLQDLQRILTDRVFDLENYKVAEYEAALPAIAREALLSSVHDHNPYGVPSWYSSARQKIEDYIAHDASARSVLRNTRFFDDDPDVQRRFCVSVSASIVPMANYGDPMIYAAAVATGRIFCHNTGADELGS